jgi:hypothetical protein
LFLNPVPVEPEFLFRRRQLKIKVEQKVKC